LELEYAKEKHGHLPLLPSIASLSGWSCYGQIYTRFGSRRERPVQLVVTVGHRNNGACFINREAEALSCALKATTEGEGLQTFPPATKDGGSR
jgi:hypothetical protein